MKKILFLLLSTIAMYGQVPADATPLENIQITNNTTDNSATKVNVQSTDGTINTISKSDLVNVVEVNDVPSLPLIGEVGKIYVVKNLNKIYRWNGTFYQELTTDISGKEDIANKQNSLAVDLTNLKYPTVTAVNTGLALKADLASPALTGTPTAPTAAAGTNTTQIATTAFVQAGLNLKSNLSDITLQRAYDTSTDKKIQTLAIRPFTLKAQTAASSDNVFVIENSSGFTVASVGAQGKLGAVSASVEGDVTGNFFIKRSTPTTKILLAGGGDISQASLPISTATQTVLNGKENAFTKNTAFNKNFGTTAGTVVEGGTLGSNAYTSTAYLPSYDGVRTDINYNTMLATGFYNSAGSNTNNPVGQSYSQLIVARGVGTGFQIAGGWNTDALHFRGWSDYGSSFTSWRKVWHDGNFNPANYLPLSGGTVTGNTAFTSTVTAAPATLPNHVVVKSQLDAVANIAGTSGSYTPSLSNLTNISNSSFDSASYTKIGNVVTARVSLFITAVTPSVTAVLDFLLPVPRVSTNVTGIGLGSSFKASMVVNTNSNTTTARLSYQPLVSTNHQVVVMFQYIVD